MTPTWYDILDVDPSATSEEIRDAWRASIANLDPGDRRFNLRNEAAEVLLDEDRRAEYDSWLTGDDADLVEVADGEAARDDPWVDADVEETSATEGDGGDDEPIDAGTDVRLDHDAEANAPVADPDSDTEIMPVDLSKSEQDPEEESEREPVSEERLPATDPGAPSPRRGPSALVLGLLAVVASALVVLTVVVVVVQERVSAEEEAAAQGLAAAEQAIVPVLSYDYRQMDQTKAAAENFLTPDYTKEYAKLFAQLEINLPETETVVTTEVVASGIVSAQKDEVVAFVFINRPTVKKDSEPRVYRDQVTVKMKLIGDEWLIDELRTEVAPT